MPLKLKPYPVPGRMGGLLIRKVIQEFKTHRERYPIDSHIHIAVSGGADSLALAHLMIHYGRKIQPHLNQISLLHINHRWRGKESDGDEKFLVSLAKTWKVKCLVFRAPKVKKNSFKKAPQSLEELARKFRKEKFLKYPVVFTAHHQDDVYETLIWRFFTGQFSTHSQGVLFKTGNELRPFLNITKNEILDYLKEEKISFRHDSSNDELNFLRNKIRKKLIPEIHEVFPSARKRVLEFAKLMQPILKNQKPVETDSGILKLQGLATLVGVKMRKTHIDALSQMIAKNPSWSGKLSIEGGWIIERQKSLDFENYHWVLKRSS